MFKNASNDQQNSIIASSKNFSSSGSLYRRRKKNVTDRQPPARIVGFLCRKDTHCCILCAEKPEGSVWSRPQMPFYDFSRFFHDLCVKREKTGAYRSIRQDTNLRLKMVHPARFELTTYCSGGNRSIQLSYGCTKSYSAIYSLMGEKSNRISLPDRVFFAKNFTKRSKMLLPTGKNGKIRKKPSSYSVASGSGRDSSDPESPGPGFPAG